MNPLNSDLTCKYIVLKRDQYPADIPDGRLVVFCEGGAGCEVRAASTKIRGRAVASGNVEEFDSEDVDRLATAEEITHAEVLASRKS